VMLRLILTHSDEWSYPAAERKLEHSVNSSGKRRTQEINGFETEAGLIWAEEQWPKQRRDNRR
jgi:hypothetical protein